MNLQNDEIQLKTNFFDFYDCWFMSSSTKTQKVFERDSRIGPNRPLCHFILENKGLNVPKRGFVSTLNNFDDGKDLVVYDDLKSHRGENKRLVKHDEFVEDDDWLYAIEYVEPISPSSSIRWLVLGEFQFVFQQQSNHDWMSNCGSEIDIEIKNTCEPGQKPLFCRSGWRGWPVIFSVDFIVDKDGVLWAIDLNVAPQALGTGVEKLVKGKDVFSSILSTVKKREAPIWRHVQHVAKSI